MDADTTQTSWSPTDEVFDFAAVSSSLTHWLTGAQPVDWDALWEEYSVATRPAPTPPQEGDYCRAHGIQIIDLTDYSTARQIAAETGLALDGVFYWSRVTDNPFTEVCNPDFEAELAAHSAGTRAEGGRPTVQRSGRAGRRGVAGGHQWRAGRQCTRPCGAHRRHYA